MDKTNGSRTHMYHTCTRTHMYHTCTYTLPVILEPYKHRNYCKHNTTLFPVLLQTILFSGVAWSLLCLLSSATAALQDGRGKLKPRAATPSRVAASASGVKRNACVCVAALSVRLLFCPVGSAAVFFVGATVAVLSCISACGWRYRRVLRLRNC
jgi:hypothetical protein